MNRIVTSSEALSDRERAVAERFAAGMTYREISEALFIAPSTVRTHLAAIYEKLGVRNKVALARHINGTAGLESFEPDALPVLALFPIESLSTEERWRRFADGLSSDITVDLARYADIPVIAFHTMKSLGSKPADFAADGKALGATYFVSGQLRADDRRVRLTIELADAQSGVGLWNERVNAEPATDLLSMLAHSPATRNMDRRTFLGNILLLIVGGVFAFLPILGVWMLPLGLALLAEDVRPLRSLRSRTLDWVERRHPYWLEPAAQARDRA